MIVLHANGYLVQPVPSHFDEHVDPAVFADDVDGLLRLASRQVHLGSRPGLVDLGRPLSLLPDQVFAVRRVAAAAGRAQVVLSQVRSGHYLNYVL